MSQPPRDDREWVDFLRQNRSQPPPPAADLEDRILAAIASPDTSRRPRLLRSSRVYWIPPAIAATLVAGLLAHRSFIPAPPNPTEVSAIENFIETSWTDTVSDNTDELTPLHDPTISTSSIKTTN
jgi:hypothetical protein